MDCDIRSATSKHFLIHTSATSMTYESTDTIGTITITALRGNGGDPAPRNHGEGTTGINAILPIREGGR